MISDPTYNHAMAETFLHMALVLGAVFAVCVLFVTVVCVFWDNH